MLGDAVGLEVYLSSKEKGIFESEKRSEVECSYVSRIEKRAIKKLNKALNVGN